MKGIEIYLADEDYEGAMIIKCPSSSCVAVRAEKKEASQYNELNAPGIYFLLVDSDSVYVGQSGLDTVARRIMNAHSGSIDSSWHTVVGFVDSSNSLQSNELLYIENAMCEYVHYSFSNCLTSTPSKANCNAAYRKSHYHLSTIQIKKCDQYISDIKKYISLFHESFFPKKYRITIIPPANTDIFYFTSPKRDSDGKAEIQINLGHTKARQAILKAGSKVSLDVSDSFKSAESVRAHRQQLISQGLLINRILQQDIPFDSQSGAGQFLNGTSFDGNSNWKTINGDVKLKDLL